jgi:hypothetical protein
VLAFLVGIASILVLYGLIWILLGILSGLWWCVQGSRGGWEMRIEDDGSTIEQVWVRKRKRWWRRSNDSDILVIDGSEDRRYHLFPWSRRYRTEEERPLLS